MVVSLKANKKRVIAFFLLTAIIVGACVLLCGGDEEKETEIFGRTNEERVAYLESFGWQVQQEAAETREVMIPTEFNDVYTAYNVMQQAQGFDLEPYAGEVCVQYKYKIENYPEETEVYATLLVCGEKIVGGDVACAEVDGFMHGFAPDSARYGETPTKKEPSKNAEEKEEVPVSSKEPVNSQEAGSEPEAGNETAAKAQEETLAPEEADVASTAGDAMPEEAFPTD